MGISTDFKNTWSSVDEWPVLWLFMLSTITAYILLLTTKNMIYLMKIYLYVHVVMTVLCNCRSMNTTWLINIYVMIWKKV